MARNAHVRRTGDVTCVGAEGRHNSAFLQEIQHLLRQFCADTLIRPLLGAISGSQSVIAVAAHLMRQSFQLIRRTPIDASLLYSEIYQANSIRLSRRLLRSERLIIQAARAPQGRIRVADGRHTDAKHLARAFRSLPVCVITVSKGGSRAAEDLAGVQILPNSLCAPRAGLRE